MHILVLSAFRRRKPLSARSGCGMRSQCTFWCSVLSDGIHRTMNNPIVPVSMHLLALSAFRHETGICVSSSHLSLNAPFGAQCFPTQAFAGVGRGQWSQCTFWCSVLSDWESMLRGVESLVSMHLLVLSAFRPVVERSTCDLNHVSMHLLVLSAFRPGVARRVLPPVGVSMHLLVLSAFRPWPSSTRCTPEAPVSMHLLVLSAFRLGPCASAQRWGSRLNAPFGAQCFPTRQGAAPDPKGRAVSMHLLVLSAF